MQIHSVARPLSVSPYTSRSCCIKPRMAMDCMCGCRLRAVDAGRGAEQDHAILCVELRVSAICPLQSNCYPMDAPQRTIDLSYDRARFKRVGSLCGYRGLTSRVEGCRAARLCIGLRFYGRRAHRDWNRSAKKASVLGNCRAYLAAPYVADLGRPRGERRISARWGRLERNGDRTGQPRRQLRLALVPLPGASQ
jgi:hypothetical protein